MKILVYLASLSLIILACGDSSTSNTSEFKGLPVNKGQVLSGSMAGIPFTFVSGSFDREGDVLHINLYPEAPLPKEDRLWSPWDNNLNMIMFPIPAKVSSYIIPYKLNPELATVSSPTLYIASDARNIISDFGTVEIYRIDEVAGVVEGGLHVSDPERGTDLNGTFSVQALSSF